MTRNPEYYTIWNIRRRILQHQLEEAKSGDESNAERKTSEAQQAVSDLLTNDLNFLLPLLRKFPKCYWIWNYRLWLLEQSIKVLPTADAREFWEQELGLAGKMLSLDNRNFHGWGYRRQIVSALDSPALQSSGEPVSLTEQEFQYTTKMVNTKLSNFSAWHNRSKLIPRLLDERGAGKEERVRFLDQG